MDQALQSSVSFMSKSASTNKLKKYVSVHKELLIIALLIFLGLGVYKGVEYYSQKKLENRFSILEDNINQFQSNIQKTAPSFTTKKNKYCRKDGEKYGGGTLRCFITLNIFSNHEKRLINLTERFLRSNQWQTIKEDSLEKHLATSIYKNTNSNIQCLLSISNTYSGKQKQASLDCFEKSHRAFYPYR